MPTLRRCAALVLFLAALTARIAPALGADGDPDAGFGTAGHVVDAGADAFTTGVAATPEGGAVVLGYAGSGYRLVRYAADGSRVASFGSGGIQTFTPPAGAQAAPVALVVQADGRIVVASTSSRAADRSAQIQLDRYLPGGQADGSFGAGGSAMLQADSGSFPDSEAVALADAGNGTVIVEGSVDGDNGMAQLLARYTASGTLDAGFGAGGLVLSQLGSDDDPTTQPMSLGIAAGGAIVTGGVSGFDAPSDYLARYTPGGALDPSYGSGGIAHPFSGPAATLTPYHAAVDPAGRVLIAGYDAGENPLIGRVNAGGSLDAGFGNGGVTALPDGSDISQFVVQPDGRILTVGYGLDGQGYSAVGVQRYTAAGTLDPSFGGDGQVTTQLSPLTACSGGDGATPGSWATSGTLAGSRLVVVGAVTTDSSCTAHLALVRYAAFSVAGPGGGGQGGGADSGGSSGGAGSGGSGSGSGSGGGSGSGSSRSGSRPHPVPRPSPAPARTHPVPTIGSSWLPIWNGTVALPVTCSEKATCRGSLTLRARLGVGARARSVVIGAKAYSIPAGRRRYKVVVRVTRAARNEIGKRRRLAVTVQLVTSRGGRRSSPVTLHN